MLRRGFVKAHVHKSRLHGGDGCDGRMRMRGAKQLEQKHRNCEKPTTITYNNQLVTTRHSRRSPSPLVTHYSVHKFNLLWQDLVRSLHKKHMYAWRLMPGHV